MFERYTERARRVLFFARYEASQLGSLSIETEHILLGLIREGKGLTSRIFAQSGIALDGILTEIEGRSEIREKVSTSVEIPFSPETKRALGFAAEEADRLLHHYIGTEHLLLGLLREENSIAASILTDKGLRLQDARDAVVDLLASGTSDEATAQYETGYSSPARPGRATVPDFVPSLVVHIAYSDYTPAQAAWVQQAPPAWRGFGFTLAQIVAHAWQWDENRVKVASGLAPGRYDFMIVLPAGETAAAIPGMLRDAIESQFGVNVTREDGDAPTLTIRPR